MKALVIYDLSGKIWSITYGDYEAPLGLLYLIVDIPDGAVLDHIDVTDTVNPQPVFTYLPESDIGKLQTQTTVLTEEVEELTLALAELIGGES